MSSWITLFNDIAVGIFGSVLSMCFGSALHTRRKVRIFWGCMAVVFLLQGGIYSIWDAEFLRGIYPLVMHLPLILVLYVLTKRLLWTIISVFSAYLCCQLRRWIALLIIALVFEGPLMQDSVELIITVPLFLFLFRFVAPAVRKMADYPTKLQVQFGLIPTLYYIFDYLTVVYTNLLSSGEPVIVEFMPFVCCCAYLVFVVHYCAEERKRSQLLQVQKSLDVQLSQSVREINALRESQALTSRYRHDLRHHLQYVSACIANGQEEQAQTYISGICQEIEAQKVQRYCENEAANLILSAFDGRAKKSGVEMKVQGALPACITVSDRDLCVLLSNALENALYACQNFANTGASCVMDVQFFDRGGTFFLQVKNPCSENIRFENGIPVSDKPGHGIGVQSICAIVQQYGGIYSFLVENGQFILQLSI